MLLQDLRFALRQLWISPGHCAAIVLTLALGIGVNTAVFSMLDAFLLRKLPYLEPERVGALFIHLQGTSPTTGKTTSEDDDSFTGATWDLLKQNVDAVQFASYGGMGGGINLKAENGAAKYVRGSRVSANYFSVVGIPLRLGREFSAEEDRRNGPAAVVISDSLWRNTLSADPQIVGKAILLKGAPYTVVGVLAPNAVTPTKAEVFTPLQPAPTGECGGNNCGIFVRLKPGASWQQVDAQLSRIRLSGFANFEKRYHGHAQIMARPLQLELAGEQHDQIIVLMVAVAFILLIACANLASLALVRISRRAQEIATRLAVGASSWAVLRQLWIENLLLALIGAAAAILLAFGLIEGLTRLIPLSMQPVGGFSIDPRALAFTLLISVLTSVLFGAFPALQAWRLDLRTSIVSNSRAILGGSGRLRQWLIGSEIALTVVLLAAAGLLIRTLIHLETRPPGFDPQNVMTAKVSLDDARYHDAGKFQALLAQGVEEMRNATGTQDVAMALSLPYERGLNDSLMTLDGQRANQEAGSSLSYVTPGFFTTLRIPLLSGRLFTDSDSVTSEPVAVINQSFARDILRESSPLGHHFKLEGTAYTVVGVVSDVAKSLGMDSGPPIATEPVFYVPATQMQQGLVNLAHVWFQPSWIVRMRNSDKPATMQRMEQALSKVAPDLPVSGFYSMDQILGDQLRQQRIEVTLLASLAGLALLLSAVGIYALVSNLVVQRRREIGIRMILGSSVQQAMADVGRPGAIATLVGVAVGIALSFAALRVLASQIFGVQVYDPLTLVSVTALLVLISALAIVLPALRITSVEPAETLRAE